MQPTITYLYHKRHLKTKLNYFGKTIQNPKTYKGSGLHWTRHLAKHGRDVETIQIWEFTDIEECSKFALEFSQSNDIVNSKLWANVVPEDGKMGGRTTANFTKEQLELQSERRKVAALKDWETRDRTAVQQQGKLSWENKTEEERAKSIQKLLDGRKLPDGTYKKYTDLKEKYANADKIICTHCKFVGVNVSGMKRHHFDNCKLVKPIVKDIICPHCNFAGSSVVNMKRYHFDNCKLVNSDNVLKCPHCGKDEMTLHRTTLIGWHFDKCQVKMKNTISNSVCPHCNISGQTEFDMRKYHFDKCKLKLIC